MRTVLFLALFLFPVLAFSQDFKIDKKTGTVLVNGVPGFRFEKDGCTFGSGTCSYDVYDTSGKRVLHILMKTYRHPQTARTTDYFQFLFVESKKTADVEDVIGWERNMMQLIVKSKLFAGGKLDESRVDEFLLLHGSPYSSKP